MPVGVTTPKKIIPIIIGDINLPNNNPNLNQNLFKGDKTLEFINPKTKKIIAIIKDHILNSSLLINGYIAISKKTIEKTIPKLLFELIFISSIQ